MLLSAFEKNWRKVSILCIMIISVLVLFVIFLRSKNNIASLCYLVEELQQKDMLDGQVCIVKKSKAVLNEKSKSVLLNSPDQSQFLIGSLSKQFTAVALLRLFYAMSGGKTEEEKSSFVEVQLHQPLSHFLSSDHQIWSGSMPAWADEITLHQLLSHTAGIANLTKFIFDTSGFDGFRKQLSTPHTPAQIIKLLLDKPLMFQPGTNYSYSNEGYLLLAEVIEIVSGMPFAQYIENMCHSIGMTKTSHPQRGNWKQIRQQKECSLLLPELVYNATDKEAFLKEPAPIMWDDISNARGAGGLVSTMQDLIIWNEALHKSHTLLPQQLYALFIKPNLKNYGYGIQNKNGILAHNGEIDSYFSRMMYMPKDDVLVIALFHINCDETLKKIPFMLEDFFKSVILDESERKSVIANIAMELDRKYPTIRGAARIRKFEMVA